MISTIRTKLANAIPSVATPASNAPATTSQVPTQSPVSSSPPASALPSPLPLQPEPSPIPPPSVALTSNISTPANESSVQVAPTPVVETGTTTVGPFKCTEGGLFPDPTSCTQFVQCDDSGNMYKMTCPSGLHFNKETLVCDWPYAAGCDKTKSKVDAE